LCAAAAVGRAAAGIDPGPGFEHFYNLEYDAAIAEFEKEIRQAPNNPFAYTHLAQALLYKAMYKAGAMESELVSGNNHFLRSAKITPPEHEQRRFAEAIEKAKAAAQARRDKNPGDMEATYALGVAHGLNANYNFLIRKLWRDSLREFTQARKFCSEVVKANPQFVDAMMVEGVHDYAVGSLPWHWKLLGFLIGFRGDKEGGIKLVERVAAEGVRNKVDAMILLGVVYRREKMPEKAIPIVEKLIQMFPRNHIFRLELVQMYGDAGNKDAALAVLRKMDELKAAGAPGYKELHPAKIQYARGNLLFWYRDYEGALANLSKVTPVASQIDINTGVNAWLRTGQVYDILGKRGQALSAYRRAIEGAPDSDAAKEARRYLSSRYVPEPPA
jgi:tetratricopeptide (TPR) repeat protein